MARSDMSDLEWEFIKVVLPNKVRGKKRVDDRRVINGIFYVLRTGIPWADLPADYGLQPLQPVELCWPLGPDHGGDCRRPQRGRRHGGRHIHPRAPRSNHVKKKTRAVV